MSCLEHRKCPAWNTGIVLRGTQEMFCLEHTKCFAWNTRNVLFVTKEISRVQQKNRPVWSTRNIMFGTQEMWTMGSTCAEHVRHMRGTRGTRGTCGTCFEAPEQCSEPTQRSCVCSTRLLLQHLACVFQSEHGPTQSRTLLKLHLIFLIVILPPVRNPVRNQDKPVRNHQPG